MSQTENIITLQPQHREGARALIIRAFRDDPLLPHLARDPGRAERLLHWFAATGVKYGERWGRVYVNPELTGVAIWFGPQGPFQATDGMWRGAMWLPFLAGWGCFLRFLSFAKFAEKVHRGIISGDHYYLFILVVAPEHQGRGLGSRLLQPVLAQADSQGRACYLETANPKALPFYYRLGFHLARHNELQPGGPGLWTMLRNPVP
jgi:GNAT superfamily N-acetyltransferase